MSIFQDKQQIADQVEAVVTTRLAAREKACAHREKALAEARFDIEHLLGLLTDLGYQNLANRMRRRLERSGAI